MNSSSTVSMRLRVRGPVSVQRCLPMRPNRGSSVASSVSAATHFENSAWPELRPECRILGVVLLLGKLFGVQVVEVAEELVEAVDGRQVLVAVAQVILAELAGRIALRLEHFGQRGRCRLQAQLGARRTDGRQAAANRVLPRDERCSPSGARRLGIVIAEHHAFTTDAVDVGRRVTHHAWVVEADVRVADVIAEDNEDIGPGGGHRPACCQSRKERECQRPSDSQHNAHTRFEHDPPLLKFDAHPTSRLTGT